MRNETHSTNNWFLKGELLATNNSDKTFQIYQIAFQIGRTSVCVNGLLEIAFNDTKTKPMYQEHLTQKQKERLKEEAEA